jgi:molybdenum cofactor cytidylyltransferase
MREAAGAAPARQIVGVLLAAGKGARFDPSGRQSKLLQRLPSGETVAVAAVRALQADVPHVVAVVKPDDAELATLLQKQGCQVVVCADAGRGMGTSLAYVLSQLKHADGWIVALADMPFVQPATVGKLLQALLDGADIAAPVHQGRRGNPVAFSARHLPQLLTLDGDQGARSLLAVHPITLVEVNDAGVLRDIDTPTDLP